MKLTRILRASSALVISLSALLSTSMGAAFAIAPETCTWIGAGTANFSDATNWSGCSGAAPVSSDSLSFPYGNGIANMTLNNDLPAGTSFGNIQFFGTAVSGDSYYDITGNSIGLTGGISDLSGMSEIIGVNISLNAPQTFSVIGNGALSLDGVLSGAGDLSKNGTGDLYFNGANTFTGNFTSAGGTIYSIGPNGLGSNVGSTTINDSSDLYIADCLAVNTVVNENINLNGNSSSPAPTYGTPTPKLVVGSGSCGGVVGYDEIYGSVMTAAGSTATLSGNITLGANTTVGAIADTLTMSGP
ncbi:MAG: hypothetical protein QFB86_04650, partial [Patescibacteria group bacterium]|nr:hypothetical protein [Patescibacteria group bacterium]